jgi:hypothetical protein
LLTFKRKRQLFKLAIAVWTVGLVIALSIISHASKPVTFFPELVFIAIFLSLGLLAVAGVILCRCPHCGVTLFYESLPGVEIERACPACRAPLT